MDKRIASNVVVGLFTLIGFGLLLFLIFSMGGGEGLFGSGLTVYGRFAQVKGLHYGSEVALSGLRVGTVKGITIAPDETKDLIVELSINKKSADRIRKDSTAKVVTQGVLGDKYIELTIGNPNQPPVKTGDFIPTAEVEDIFAKGGSLVDDISKQFIKGGELDNLLRNLNRVAMNLNTITTDAQKGNGLANELVHGTSGKKLNDAVVHLESILGKVDRGEGTLGGIINDPTVYEDLKSIVGGAKRSSILKYFMNQFRESGQKATPQGKQ
jgi:phospholipid/cholesterol/gamma-HCH transport system substrate-binding protein